MINIENIVAKTTVDDQVVKTVSTHEVVLKALCAYRDNLVMSDDWLNNQDQISLINAAIDDVWVSDTPAKS